jgi:hypothetical protein
VASALARGAVSFLDVLNQERQADQANRRWVYNDRMKVFHEVAANEEDQARWDAMYALRKAESDALVESRNATAEARSQPETPTAFYTGELARGEITPEGAAKALSLFQPLRSVGMRTGGTSTSTAAVKPPPDLAMDFVTGYQKQLDDYQAEKKTWEAKDLFGDNPYPNPEPNRVNYFNAVTGPRAGTLGLKSDSIRANLSAYYPELAMPAAGTPPAAGVVPTPQPEGLTAEEQEYVNEIRGYKTFDWDAAATKYPNVNWTKIRGAIGR